MEEFIVGNVEGFREGLEESNNPKRAKVVSADLATQSVAIDSQHHETGRSILKLALIGSTVFLGYEGFARLPAIGWLHTQHGGFWRGFIIASVAGISVLTSVVLYLEGMSSRGAKTNPYAYPAHYKPDRSIIKPITQNIGWLKPQEYQKLPLSNKEKLSTNTHRLTFKLPSPNQILGLPIGQHVAIRAEIDGKAISRSYTPVSNNSDPGTLQLVIKMYSDGQLTGKYLEKLEVGDQVEFRGPKGQMRYRKEMARNIGMIAGGTGITPMYQLIRAICEDPKDNTTVSLLYGNNTEQDILLRNELDTFASKYPRKFSYESVLSKPGSSWSGKKGFINKDLVKEKLPPPSDSKILLCGPPGLINAMTKSLVELGFDKPNTVSKMADQVFLF
jgi:cytochrome-b5 reductase